MRKNATLYTHQGLFQSERKVILMIGIAQGSDKFVMVTVFFI